MMDMLQTLRDYRRAVKDDPAPLLALFAEVTARAEAAEELQSNLTAALTRVEAAEKRVQELTAAIDDWRERAEEAEGKLAKTADDLAAALWRVAKLETDYVSENRLRGEAAASAANLEAALAAARDTSESVLWRIQ